MFLAKNMNIALVHDHLAQDGGAEKVLSAFASLYPHAPIYTLLGEKKQIDKYFANRTIETSIIQKLPGGVKHYKWYMPFMPMAVEFFDLRPFDVVLSDASAFAKGVITSPHTLHISYCHTPTRYLWDYTHQYISELKYNKFVKKAISLVLNYIRLWDKAAADRVDVFIANSRYVQKRIKKYYRRRSMVIYPPVEVDKGYIAKEKELGDYFLLGGRLAPYKRFDIAIEAFKELGLKLKIFGDGIDAKRLRRLAGNNPQIEFLGRVDSQTKFHLYAHCQAFINPQEEDFGITAVEAMACGRPVIAYNRGGAAETVQAGVTGLFFAHQTPAALAAAVREFRSQASRFKPAVIRAHSQQFSLPRFKQEISKAVEDSYEKFKQDSLFQFDF